MSTIFAIQTAKKTMMKPMSRAIPPLQLGGVALGMGFLITFFAVVIAQMVLRSFA